MSESKKMHCSFCDFLTSKLTIIGNKTYCFICRLTLKPTTHDTHKIIAVYSILQQVMINKLYREFILKYNSIPQPHDIDPNCRLILYNPTVLHEICNLMSNDERLSFMNIKYFLTDQVRIDEIKVVNFFAKIGGNSIHGGKNGVNGEKNGVNGEKNGVNGEKNRVFLLKHQKNLIDKFYQKFIDNNLSRIQILFH
jgi:hypothetical protein